MDASRRSFIGVAAGAVIGAGSAARLSMAAGDEGGEITVIDTHQHLWDRSKLDLPWLANAEEVLRRDYLTEDYLQATRGLGVSASIYMEVDVAPEQHVAEAESVLALCGDPKAPTIAAVLGGRPASPEFGAYLDRVADDRRVKGIRQVLHGDQTPPGTCLMPKFVRGIRLLGERGLRFDLCMRPAELGDAVALVERCPDTFFILDHCGNADPNAFNGSGTPSHDPDAWRRQIEALAARPNVACKISGIVAKAPKGWGPDDLAPIVNHCLDAFGADRVVFGGDWPVCLLGASYRQWLEALRAIVADRPEAERRKLFADNAVRIYDLAP